MYSTVSTYAAARAEDPKVILHPQSPFQIIQPECPPRVTGTAISSEDNILIRPFQAADAEPMHEAAVESMEDLCAWMTWCRPEYAVADARAFIAGCGPAWKRGAHFSFAIIDARNREFLGSAGLNNLNAAHKVANIGYWVRSSASGRGVATTATRLIAAFALRSLGLNRLEILIPEVNVASQRVAQKAGAKFEGLLRNRLVIAGGCHDAALYSILPADLAEP